MFKFSISRSRKPVIARLSGCAAVRAGGTLLALSAVLFGQATINEFSIPTAVSSSLVITKGPDGNLWFAEFNGNQIGRMVLASAPAAVPTLSGWSLSLGGILLVALGAGTLLARPRRDAVQ